MMDRKVIGILRFRKFGYAKVREEIEIGPNGETMVMKGAYVLNEDGSLGPYIGGYGTARDLCEKRGIRPELQKLKDSICTVGKSSQDGKWYGWLHRAIHGYRTRKRAALFAESVG